MDPKTFIFIGRSGSGKGTQARLLAKYLEEKTESKVLYVETGAMFREFMEDKNFSSRLTKETIDRGELLPEFLPIWMWSDFLIKNFTGEEHLVFDGVARHIGEAPVLDAALSFYERRNPYLVYLDVSRARAFELLKNRGREDDDDKYINARLDWFDSEVMPSIEYFKNNQFYTFLNINGEQSIKEVHEEIVKKSSK